MTGSALVRRARFKAGLSQRELSRRTGIAQPTIARIEARVTSPRFDTMNRLLAACGFSLELVPLGGYGIDRTAIRQLLSLTPTERLRLAREEQRNLQRFEEGVRR